MPWVRLHDGLMQHAKIAALSDGAFRLWIVGLCYCQSALTDGFIPNEVIPRDASRVRYVRELTRSKLPGRAALWKVVRGGFQVHDYLQWNDGRREILQKRASHAARTRRWRDGRDASRDASPDAFETRSQRDTTTTTTIKDKSSGAAAPQSRPNAAKDNVRVIERLAHDAIEQHPDDSYPDQLEDLKGLCAKFKIPYDSTVAGKALDSAAHTRRTLK